MCELLFFAFYGWLAFVSLRDYLRGPAALVEEPSTPPPMPGAAILQRPPGPAVERLGLTDAKRRAIGFTAIHEAAHVVVLSTLWPDRGIERVSILSEGSHSGSLLLAKGVGQRARSRAEEQRQFLALGATSLAGLCAERRAGRPEDDARAGSTSDIKCAVFLSRCLLARGFRPTLLSRLQSEEKRLVRTFVALHLLATEVTSRRWRSIEALAEALLEHGTLEGPAAIAASLPRPEEALSEEHVRKLLRSL
jgi:hypothetical protein